MCNPGIRDCELADAYANSFLSILRPGVALSKNTVSTFHKNAGKSFSQIVSFMRNRAAKLTEGDHVLVERFEGKLPGCEGVVHKKVKCNGGKKWLYSFRDVRTAASEERNDLEHLAGKDYKTDVYEAKRETFGTIVLERDLDLPPEIVYRAYGERWQIELVMRYYKSACEFDDTRVHSDYSVIGSEFCDFLATVLTLTPHQCLHGGEAPRTRPFGG